MLIYPSSKMTGVAPLALFALLPLSALFATMNISCQTTESKSEVSPEVISQELAYVNMVEQYTRSETKYSGFYNLFEVKATLLKPKMVEAQLRKRSALQQWDREKADQERAKKARDMASQTEVFVSFYSPEKGVANLEQKKTTWRAYLDVNGRRYIGDVRKSSTNLVDILAFYPYHNRWSTAYTVVFSVPANSIAGLPVQLTLTGSVGSSTLTFDAD